MYFLYLFSGLIEIWLNFRPNLSKYLFVKCYSKMSGIYIYIPSVKFYISSIKNDILNAFQYSNYNWYICVCTKCKNIYTWTFSYKILKVDIYLIKFKILVIHLNFPWSILIFWLGWKGEIEIHYFFNLNLGKYFLL